MGLTEIIREIIIEKSSKFGKQRGFDVIITKELITNENVLFKQPPSLTNLTEQLKDKFDSIIKSEA